MLRFRQCSVARGGFDVTDPVLSDGAAAYTPGISERRSSATKYMHEDFLGSTTRLTDSSQATTDTRQYDAFGNLTGTSGTTPTPFGFAGGWGYQSDADSGLQLLGHRYYDPSTGRFLTRDPARDGRNWYAYVRSSPTDLVDPAGLMYLILAAARVFPTEDGSGIAGGESGWPGDAGEFPSIWEFLLGKAREGTVEGVAGAVDAEGAGAVAGAGMTVAEGTMTLGKGVLVVGGYRKRLEDIMEGDDDALSGENYDPWHHHRGGR